MYHFFEDHRRVCDVDGDYIGRPAKLRAKQVKDGTQVKKSTRVKISSKETRAEKEAREKSKAELKKIEKALKGLNTSVALFASVDREILVEKHAAKADKLFSEARDLVALSFASAIEQQLSGEDIDMTDG